MAMNFEKDWYEKAICKVHLDMHFPEWDGVCENFDAKQIIDLACEAGADSLYFFTKDCYGNCFYQTKVGHVHRCMGDRDFLSEILEESQKAKFPIMGYYTVIWDNIAAKENPEWCMLDETGEPLMDTVTMDDGKWRYVCHNTGYADFAVSMVEEIAKNYPVQGFHMDMFNMSFGGLSCYCETCQKMFKEQYGKDLPREPKWDQTWREFLEFRYRSVERFAQRLREGALRQNPDLCCVMNYHGSPGFDWRVGQKPVMHNLFSDMGTGETYTPMFGDMYPGMESRFLRGLVPGKPFEMVSWRMNRFTDYTVKPANQLRWEVYTSIVNGGSAMLIDQPFHDGKVDPVAYDRMGEVFKETKEIEEYLGGDYLKHVAIFYSCRNRDLYGRSEQQKFIQPIVGAYKALIESHISVDFIFDETLTAEIAAAYPVIVLPNVAALTDAEIEIFTEYVRNGGNLIATFDTSLCDENGERLYEFRMKELFGVHFKDTLDCDNNWFRAMGETLGEGIDPRYYVFNQGAAHIVEATTAKATGDLYDSFHKRIMPDHFFSHNIHPPHHRFGNAVYVNEFGKGKCVYVPFALDASYADTYELPEHRVLTANIVRMLSPEPLVKIDAPLNVEALVTEKDGKILVHLVAFNPNRQATTLPSLDAPIRPSIRMEEPLIYRARITAVDGLKGASALRDKTVITTEGDTVFITCEDIHEVIVIDRK